MYTGVPAARVGDGSLHELDCSDAIQDEEKDVHLPSRKSYSSQNAVLAEGIESTSQTTSITQLILYVLDCLCLHSHFVCGLGQQGLPCAGRTLCGG